MRYYSLPICIFAIACGLLANAAPAWAVPETWVSGTGSDAGTCPIAAPCLTFQYAHSQTGNNGAINVLSSGNFGPVKITKSISIVADGVEAVINTALAGGAGIKVQAGAAAIVSLRGLTVDLRGTDNDGIHFFGFSGQALHVHNSVIRRANFGILFEPTSLTSQLHVADSVIANSAGSGIWVGPTGSGSAKATVDRVRVENNAAVGIEFDGTATTGSIAGTVRDSVVAGNGNAGIGAHAGGGEIGPTTNVMIDRSAAVNNGGAGIAASGARATIRIGDSTVSGNGGGLYTRACVQLSRIIAQAS